MEKAVLGGGCFWCLEAFFNELKGVEKVVSGYAGGPSADRLPNPTYELVSMGSTGHAEVVEITFDPGVLSFETLLTIFFAAHDPTTLNRQGNDIGEQYRSIILYENEEQKQRAEKKIQELTEAKKFSDPIVTQVVPLDTFYTAEEYHQNYYKNNPNQPYCSFVISPKMKKLREEFKDLLR